MLVLSYCFTRSEFDSKFSLLVADAAYAAYTFFGIRLYNITKIMHALGFWHEQMRPDRDQHVYVNFNNISPAMRYNFNKMNPSSWKSFGQEYDITSVMQYHGTAFSSNGQPTMIDRSTNRPIPWNTRITQNDFDQVL